MYKIIKNAATKTPPFVKFFACMKRRGRGEYWFSVIQL